MELQGYHYYQGKNTKCGYSVSISQERQQQTLITKLRFLHKTGQKKFPSAPTWACWPKPPLHGLSFRKSPIKNHATLFRSSRVVKSNQTKLGSTKPKNGLGTFRVNLQHLELESTQSTLTRGSSLGWGYIFVLWVAE